ncbi:phospholipase D-like domain-containing protein DpdK [Pseudomonas sp. SDT291_1_S447]|jgi:hypothetical protein
MADRQIFKSATTAPSSVKDVLGILFAQELMVPSTRVILMAPWISNIVILDNRMGEFDGLNPGWGRREIRLIDILVAVTTNNTKLLIRVRPDQHNKYFKSRFLAALNDTGTQDLCTWEESAALHTKSLLTDHAVVGGSMNFTENGISFGAESVLISFDRARVAEAHTELETHGQ